MRNLAILLFFFAAFTVSAKKRYDGYQILEVIPLELSHAKALHELEAEGKINLQNEISRNGKPVSILVAPYMLSIVKVALLKAGMLYETSYSNVQKVLDAEEQRLASRLDFDVDDFNTLADIDNQLEVWVDGCPDTLTCSAYSIGTTTEGRSINAIRIGNGNPVILMDTLIHAREWLTGATTLKIIDHLLTNYDSDDDVIHLLANYDFVFVPVLNPDGYDYSWTDDRFLRKNRVVNQGSQCIGVDLNRNFDVDEFGMQGVSQSPCSDIYCGTEGGSELETQALQNEGLRLQSEGESGIIAWVTFHSYSWMWMYPWGYTEDFGDFSPCVYTDDYDDLYYVSEAVQGAIFDSSGDLWDIGTTCETIYPTTGGTDDWVKAKAGVKYVFSPELRGPGFDVPPRLIQPSFEEVWAGTVAMMNAIEELSTQK